MVLKCHLQMIYSETKYNLFVYANMTVFSETCKHSVGQPNRRRTPNTDHHRKTISAIRLPGIQLEGHPFCVSTKHQKCRLFLDWRTHTHRIQFSPVQPDAGRANTQFTNVYMPDGCGAWLENKLKCLINYHCHFKSGQRERVRDWVEEIGRENGWGWGWRWWDRRCGK